MADIMRHWTRAEVDDAVAKWNSDLQLATKNILELMDDFYYKWLAGDGGHARGNAHRLDGAGSDACHQGSR